MCVCAFACVTDCDHALCGYCSQLCSVCVCCAFACVTDYDHVLCGSCSQLCSVCVCVCVFVLV